MPPAQLLNARYDVRWRLGLPGTAPRQGETTKDHPLPRRGIRGAH